LRSDFGAYLLAALERASGGRFAAEDVTYVKPQREQGLASLSFRFAGKTWSRQFSWDMDEPFKAVRALANDAVASAGVSSQVVP
jgi:hypothetical protein